MKIPATSFEKTSYVAYLCQTLEFESRLVDASLTHGSHISWALTFQNDVSLLIR